MIQATDMLCIGKNSMVSTLAQLDNAVEYQAQSTSI